MESSQGRGGTDRQGVNEGAVGRGEGGGEEGDERSLVIDMPDITVTLLIQTDSDAAEVRGASKNKGATRGGARTCC